MDIVIGVEVIVTILRHVIVPVCLILCLLISNFLLTCFHLYMKSVPQHQFRLLNIFYSDMGLLWQGDTVLCASIVFIKIVLEVESELLDQITTHLMYLEMEQAASYLALIGATRLVAHLDQDLYLDVSNRWNGHWMLPVTLILAALLQLTTFQLSDSQDSFSLYSDLTLYSLAGTAFLLHMVLELDILLTKYKHRRSVGPVTVQPAEVSTADESLGVGSLSLLLLTVDLCLTSLFFYHNSISITSESGALIQLVNMTLLALYWTVAQPHLAQHCQQITDSIMSSVKQIFG